MPIVDHATKLITCKLVYYGPGRSGKTTNLTHLHGALPTNQVGELTSLATRRDRTLFFDYLPVDLGTVGVYRVRFQLYTVPGQPYYRAIRQLVLQPTIVGEKKQSLAIPIQAAGGVNARNL